MKIIDEKGRLFGKINIIDFLAMLFILCLLPGAYLGYKFFTSKHLNNGMSQLSTDIELPVKFKKFDKRILNLLKVGDKERDQVGNVIAEIVWVGEPEPYFYIADIGQDERLRIKDENFVDVPARLKLKVRILNNDRLVYNDAPVLLNSIFEFICDKFTTSFIIVKDIKKKNVKVRVRFQSLSPEIGKLISKGYLEKDEDNKIIGKLVSIIKDDSSKLSTLSISENKVILIDIPDRNDLEVLLELVCTEQGENLYFKNYLLKIGNQINFTSGLYSVGGLILEILPD